MTRKVASQRIISLALLATCLALAGVIYMEVTADPLSGWHAPSVPGSVGSPTQEALPVPESGFTPPPMTIFAEIVSRPLFSRSRRPPEEKDEPKSQVVKTSLNHLALIGVLIFPTERVALFEQPREPNVIEVREGQKIEDWLVESIMPDKVILSWGESRLVMTLEDDAQPRPRRATRTKRSAMPPKEGVRTNGASTKGLNPKNGADPK